MNIKWTEEDVMDYAKQLKSPLEETTNSPLDGAKKAIEGLMQRITGNGSKQ